MDAATLLGAPAPSLVDWLALADWCEERDDLVGAVAVRTIPDFIWRIRIDAPRWRVWRVIPCGLRLSRGRWSWYRWLPLRDHPRPGDAQGSRTGLPFSLPHGPRAWQVIWRKRLHQLEPLYASAFRAPLFAALGRALALPHVEGLGPYDSGEWIMVDLDMTPEQAWGAMRAE